MSIFSKKSLAWDQITLKRLFGFSEIDSVEPLHSGYKARNYKLTADGNTYFLKEYRRRLSHVVYQIKQSEEYFFSQGLPVVLPCKDVRGRRAFYLDGHWCSVFPFVNGRNLTVDDMDESQLRSLAEMTARVHLAGMKADLDPFQEIRLGLDDQFLWECEELMDALFVRGGMRMVDERILKTLQEKKRLIETANLEPEGSPLANNCLIHGDLTYQNVLVDEYGVITSLIDFEKTCLAPRAYEFGRCLMINCFDDGWDEEHFVRARLFLEAYQSVFPISFEEFLNGIRIYWRNVMHMTWLEAKYLFSKEDEPEFIYAYHSNRIAHLHEDPVAFCERIYGDR